jgi:hypothetical protein
MILNELKILFNNLKNVRKLLLTEGVSNDAIIKAINDHEYVYLYYEGDPESGGVSRGARTVRMYLLGQTTAGNLAVRSFQDRGKSFSLSPESPRKRKDHEYHIDVDGKEKPGWRLFRLDRISSLYPTGKRFIDKEGNVMIPPLYNENDKQMTSIIASVSVTPEKSVQTKDLDVVSKPDITMQKGKKSDFDVQTARFKQFYNANKNKREATARDIENLYNIAKKVMKKSPNRFFVAISDKGDFQLVDVKNKPNFPENAIVGDLTALYSKYVLSSQENTEKEKNFFNQTLNNLKKQTINKKNK